MSADSGIQKFIKSGTVDNRYLNVESKPQYKLRWDHANTDLFYSLSGELLYPIFNDISKIYPTNNDCIIDPDKYDKQTVIEAIER